MTLRLPAELDQALDAIATARSTSKHAILIEAADRFVRQESKTARVLRAIDEVGVEFADTLRRLEDA